MKIYPFSFLLHKFVTSVWFFQVDGTYLNKKNTWKLHRKILAPKGEHFSPFFTFWPLQNQTFFKTEKVTSNFGEAGETKKTFQSFWQVRKVFFLKCREKVFFVCGWMTIKTNQLLFMWTEKASKKNFTVSLLTIRKTSQV